MVRSDYIRELERRIIDLPICEDKHFERKYGQLKREIEGINDIIMRNSLMSSLNKYYNISRVERYRTHVYSWNEVR